MPKSKTITAGPFNLLTALVTGGPGQELVQFDASMFKNAATVVSIVDNVAQTLSALAQPGAGVPNITYTNIGAEIEIVGILAGARDVLKRQFVRSNWGGGMVYYFDEDLVYDKIAYNARLFFGGAPFIPTDMVLGNQLTAPLVVNAQIAISQRAS